VSADHQPRDKDGRIENSQLSGLSIYASGTYRSSCRSTAMSAIESAPATMPPTSADTFNADAWPGPPATVK